MSSSDLNPTVYPPGHFDAMPFYDEEKTIVENAMLRLEAGRIASAVKAVIGSARWASKGQDLVRRDLLRDLAEAIGDEPLKTTLPPHSLI